LTSQIWPSLQAERWCASKSGKLNPDGKTCVIKGGKNSKTETSDTETETVSPQEIWINIYIPTAAVVTNTVFPL
jgi:hypothetical protein